MKTRIGFVSNSSSSSFIVIEKLEEDSLESIPTKDGTLCIGSDGKIEFGWEIEYINEIHSKINFCYIQAMYLEEEKKDRWIKMIEDVIYENSSVKRIEVATYLENNGYVDHQSASIEGMNTEMFKSKDTLKNFIFNTLSHIQTQNDNM